ncbi:MAG: SRPBCC family protein [Gammaproteobacteria bacterium]|nr:SRPBCC family protein [Gammaproteobacteria bacterium]
MSEAPSTQIGRFHLDAPVARVFPLFTALGERAWAQGWEPELLSGREERGSAFRTVHAGRETTWIVVEYRPSEGRVSYARLAQGSNIGLVDVRCDAAGDGTDVSVRYTLTGLNPQGQEFVTEFLDPGRYGRMMDEWRAAITGALSAEH